MSKLEHVQRIELIAIAKRILSGVEAIHQSRAYSKMSSLRDQQLPNGYCEYFFKKSSVSAETSSFGRIFPPASPPLTTPSPELGDFGTTGAGLGAEAGLGAGAGAAFFSAAAALLASFAASADLAAASASA